MDDGKGGEFTTVLGADETTAQTRYVATGLVKGLFYRFKVRVRNKMEWSEWSPEVSIQAAVAPAKPLPPKLVSATATEINLQFFVPEDNGGSALTNFELYINDGDDANEANTKVASYTNNALLHTLTAATDGIVTNKIYRLRFKAINSIGASQFSDTVRYAAVDAPAAPTGLTVMRAQTSND